MSSWDEWPFWPLAIGFAAKLLLVFVFMRYFVDL
jgi:hypothetical protein